MKLSNLNTVLFASIIFCFTIAGCGGKTTAVDSGTYEGSISKVNAAEKEIYVEITGGQKLELYFTPETTLTQNGETAAFEQLKAGQQVSVEVTRVGNRVDPVAVEILGQ